MSLKRRSTLPYKQFKSLAVSSCVGCRVEVSPTLSRRGSVAVGIAFATVTTGYELVRRHPAEYAEIRKNVAFVERKKGLLCDTCASNYHTFVDHKGISHPIVITDVVPSFIGQTVAGHGIGADKALTKDQTELERERKAKGILT